MNSRLQHLNWYVVFTKPRMERKVASQISQMGVESFLPLHKVMRQWSDRKKKVEVPLFPNYVFVKISELTRSSLFSIQDLIKFVSIEKIPVVVREKEIEAIKLLMCEDVEVLPSETFQQGMVIKIKNGHLAGLEGTVVRQQSKTRLLIKIEWLKTVLSINIPVNVAEEICSLP